MIIKVCGMAQPDNIAAVAALSPMLMGFIFYEKSPRYAGNLAPEVIKKLPEYIRPVAVFVNESTDNILATTQRYGIDIVQLHGDETPEQCRELKAAGKIVLKAVSPADRTQVEALTCYDGAADMLIFDTKGGGTGRKWSWDIIRDYPLHTPYLLSGGIGVDDVDAIVDAMQPGMAGIDINSRFEVTPGVKDISLLTKFILSLRKFNENEPPSIPVFTQSR
jgi:phosphoribosylanthranilate isomerase